VTHSAYAVFGLTVRSELALPELPPPHAAGAPDVHIVRGTIDLPEADPGYSPIEGGTLLTVAKVGRFLVRGGDEIVIDAAADATDRNVRLFLLGSALGALLHQRGLLPLHANAIDLGGGAVAFSGHSGAGKSTIAAWFHDRGHRILADDVCVVGFDGSGRALAYPGIPRLRLWREALEASGRDVAGFEPSFDGIDKYNVPTGEESGGEPLPLRAVYLLEKADGPDAEPGVRRLTGVDAVEALVSNTYRGGYVRTIGRTGQHLAACIRLAREIPVFAARRRWGFDAFDAQAAALAAHAEALAVTAS
jgi:hypothetical protein